MVGKANNSKKKTSSHALRWFIRHSPHGEYFELYLNQDPIGIATHNGESYLVSGRKKPVATLDLAAEQLIETEIAKHERTIRKLRSLVKLEDKRSYRSQRRRRVG